MSQHEMMRDLGLEVTKASPPAIVAALTLNEWVAVATILYIVLQGAYLIWKWRREWVAKHRPPT